MGWKMKLYLFILIYFINKVLNMIYIYMISLNKWDRNDKINSIVLNKFKEIVTKVIVLTRIYLRVMRRILIKVLE
jgi:hypothetical protein